MGLRHDLAPRQDSMGQRRELLQEILFAAAASWRRKSMGRPREICVDICCCFPTGNLRWRLRARRGNAHDELVFFIFSNGRGIVFGIH